MLFAACAIIRFSTGMDEPDTSQDTSHDERIARELAADETRRAALLRDETRRDAAIALALAEHDQFIDDIIPPGHDARGIFQARLAVARQSLPSVALPSQGNSRKRAAAKREALKQQTKSEQ